jgi:hypothetical protein
VELSLGLNLVKLAMRAFTWCENHWPFFLLYFHVTHDGYPLGTHWVSWENDGKHFKNEMLAFGITFF